MDNVVNLHNRPSLDDMPGRLRWMADQIESGEVKTKAVVVLVYTPTGIPPAHNFGECLTTAERIALLELVKFDLMRDIT